MKYASPVVVFVFLASGCASSASNGTGFGDVDGGRLITEDAGTGHSINLADGGSSRDGGGPTTGKTLLYAHDGTKLYAVDANDPKLASVEVGTFDCIGKSQASTSMTDIAVNADGKLYGLASDTIFLGMTVSGSTVACSAVAKPLNTGGNAIRFYGASFAPKGTLDPAKEVLLVGNTAGEVYQVDEVSGATSLLNSFGTVPAKGFMYPGTPWEMSGDIVFLSNGGNPIGFATVRDCKPNSTQCNPTDTLIQIDLAKFKSGIPGNGVTVRGLVSKSASCTDTTPSYGSMFGIAAYQDKIIGFSHGGFTVSIDNATGQSCLIASNQPKWDGAGVTTIASVIAPPPPK